MAAPREPFYTDTGDVSPTLGSLTSLLGDEAVQKLSAAFGGRRIYVPLRLGESHPLAVAAGLEAAQQLAAHFAGSTLTLPITPARRQEVIDLDAAGWTKAAIAAKVRMTERRVYQILEEERAGGPSLQPSLF